VEDTRLNAPGVPGAPAVVGPGVAGLAEVGCDGVELTPGDGHAVGGAGVHGDGGLIGGVADDVVALGVGADLVEGGAGAVLGGDAGGV
jgi:hypothetical protein